MNTSLKHFSPIGRVRLFLTEHITDANIKKAPSTLSFDHDHSYGPTPEWEKHQ